MHGACDTPQGAMTTWIVTSTCSAQRLRCAVCESTPPNDEQKIVSDTGVRVLLPAPHHGSILRRDIVVPDRYPAHLPATDHASGRRLSEGSRSWSRMDHKGPINFRSHKRYKRCVQNGARDIDVAESSTHYRQYHGSISRVTMLHYTRTPSGHDNSKI